MDDRMILRTNVPGRQALVRPGMVAERGKLFGEGALSRNGYHEPHMRRFLAGLEALSAKEILQEGANEADLVEARKLFVNALRSIGEFGHARRVARNAMRVGVEMELSGEETACLHFGGFVHDIGKMLIPLEVLHKPGKLGPNDINLMREHPGLGMRIICMLDFMEPLLPIVGQHQERWNGSGYPDGLKGGSIHLLARIVKLADDWDAKTRKRRYSGPKPKDVAIGEIRDNAGIRYDPQITEIALRVFAREEIR